jgi:apolipoprotein N-acyltransferase
MKAALLALLSSCLLVISFPAFDYGFFAWVALIPLFLALEGKRPKTAFLISFFSGIIFLMGVFYWINYIKGVSPIDFLLLGIYLGSYFGFFGGMLNIIAQRPGSLRLLAAPALWVSMEYMRSHAGFLALPWALLGHTQYRYLPVIQVASLTGVYGISFLIVLVNIYLADMISVVIRKEGKPGHLGSYLLRAGFIPVVLVGLTVGYGVWVRHQTGSADKVSVTVVQGNIPQGIKWNPAFLKANIEKHVALTREASAQHRAQLIVWPESTFPVFLRHDLFFSQMIQRLSVLTRSHLLVGSSQRPKMGAKDFGDKNWYNSVYLFSPGGLVIDRYDKIRLLPFGEYLPAKDLIPWPSRFAASAGQFISGKRYTTFPLDGSRFGVLICWESLFPDLAREFVKHGASFLVNMSNEAWFGETAAPYQFLSMNVFRAVENRVCLIRSVNTGISCFIDASGEIIGTVKKGEKEIFVEGYLTREIPLSIGKTFYTLYGDLFACASVIAAICLFLVTGFTKWKDTGFEMWRRNKRDKL